MVSALALLVSATRQMRLTSPILQVCPEATAQYNSNCQKDGRYNGRFDWTR